MGATLTATKQEPLYKDKHPKGESWFCHWFDHAERHITRRLGLVDEMSEEDAKVAAKEQWEAYREAHEMKLEIKRHTSKEQLRQIGEQATFPRAVVAGFITRIGEKIARADGVEEGRGRNNSGLQLFSERSGISQREVNRLVDDKDRVAVTQHTVDKICIEFGLLFSDFFEDAWNWSVRAGRWADRPGTEDCWPIGYVPKNPPANPPDMLDF